MDAGPPAAPVAPRWWERTWLPLVLLVLGLARQLQVNLRWIEADGRIGLSVFSGMTDWLCTALAVHGTGGFRSMVFPDLLRIDLLSLTGVAGWATLGADPDTPQIVVLLCLVAAQILCFDVGRRLGSAWAGLLAALLLGVMPEASAIARCWSPQGPQLLLLVAALDLLLASRSFSRLLPSLGFVLLAVAGCAYGPMNTENILFALAAAGMAAGAWGRGLVGGRGPLPDMPVKRWRSLLGGLVVVGLVLSGSWLVHYRFMPLEYIFLEMGNEGYHIGPALWHPTALLAYPRWLVWYGLEPLLAIPILLGLALFCWHGRGRSELLGWVVVPLVALSLLHKKNPYYIAGIYPALALVAALGFASLPPRWQNARRTLMVVLAVFLGVGWQSWEQRSRATAGPQPDDGRPHLGDVFQTANPPDLHPWPEVPAKRELRFLREHIEAQTCPWGQLVCTHGLPDNGAIGLQLLAHDQCTTVSVGPPRWAPGCTWLLVQEYDCKPTDPRPLPPPPEVRAMQTYGAWVVDVDASERPCLWLLRNTPTALTAPSDWEAAWLGRAH